MNTTYKNLLMGGMLAALIMTIPLAGFAKEKDSDKDSGAKTKIEATAKIEKSERSDNDNDDPKNVGCLRAFGHLIAPGWIKHYGEIDWPTECHFPFGIGKKDHGTTTPPAQPDTTAPVISKISVSSSETKADIRWTTDERSDSTVFWATTSPVAIDATSTKSETGRFLTKDHLITLRNLSAQTTYYVVLSSRDAAGNTATSTLNFTTKSAPADTAAPIIRGIDARATGSTTASVSWMTNEQSTSKAYYSMVFPFALDAASMQSTGTTTLSTSHFLNLNGLNATTTYYLTIESKDAAGNASTVGNLSVKTGL